MNLHALYHRYTSNYRNYNKDGDVFIRFRTAKDDVGEVILIWGDQYDWAEGGGGGNLSATDAEGWISNRTDMNKELSTDLFDYWVVTVKPPYRRIRYGFLLQDTLETAFYGERRYIINPTVVDLEYLDNFFTIPFLNMADIYEAPDWVKSTIWYQIFPERFANGDPRISPVNVVPWGAIEPTPTTFYGGDLQGIRNHLEYIEELGVNGIYLCPIFHSPSTHKYNTTDYFEIDPGFGDKETFKLLVKEAHDRGIKVMIDAVFNHCGNNFFAWEDVKENKENSKFVDWFHIREFPLITEESVYSSVKQNNVIAAQENQEKLEKNEKPEKTIISKQYYKNKLNFDAFSFAPYMPKLRTENPEVSEYLLEVATYWTKEFGIDGWRLDVANEVDHVFWRKFRETVKAINPEIYILGEVWHNALPYLEGEQFDAVMHYPLQEVILEFVKGGAASTFAKELNKTRVMYMDSINSVLYNLLETHDTERAITVLGEDKRKLKLAYTILFTLKGAPSLYYGSEIGLSGSHDPECRRCMIWDEKKQDRELLSYFKMLCEVRKEYKALSSEDLQWISIDDTTNLVMYKKQFTSFEDVETIYVVVNNSEEERMIPWNHLPDRESMDYMDLITKKTARKNTVLHPYEVLLLS